MQVKRVNNIKLFQIEQTNRISLQIEKQKRLLIRKMQNDLSVFKQID